MIPYPQPSSSSFSFPLPNSFPISSSMNGFNLELQVFASMTPSPPLPMGAPGGPADPAPDIGIRASPGLVMSPAGSESSPSSPRPDLPNFAGKDVRGWLYRAQQLMDFYYITGDLRVRMAALYLEGAPLEWYRGNVRAKGKPLSWVEFKKGLVSLYDNSKARKVFDGIPQSLPLLIRKLLDTTPQSLSLTNAKYQSTTTTAAELITNEAEFVVSLESVEEKKLVEASQVQNVDGEVYEVDGSELDPVELKPAEYDDASRNVMLNRMLKCMCFKEARKTFDEMSDRVVGSWVPLLTGYAHLHRWYDVLDLFGEGAEVFDEMLERRNVLSEVTDVAFTLDDGTGKADVIRWVNETSETDKITLMENGMYVVSWSAAFVGPMAFQLKHSRPGTLSLCLLVNDGYDAIKLDAYYRNVEFLVITGSGPYPQLENANIVFGTVLEGMGVVPAIVTIPTYNAAERIRLFNDFSEFIGDKRDQIARKMWTKLLKTVYISNCGELKNMCYGSPYAQCNGSLNASIITLQYLKNEIRQQIDFDPGGVCSMVPALIEVKYNSMIEGLAKALKFYPKVPELWIYAAAWEFDQKLNVSSTHQLMWSGLKAGPNPKDPWIEHLRMELTYLNKLKAQKIELLSTFQSEINSLFISADSKGTPWPFQKGYATPVGGPAYYITEPSSMAGWAATSFHALLYIVFMMSACVLLSKTWIEVFGSLARVVAKQLKEQHVVMPGHHESYLQKELNRYMYIATVMLALTATTIVTSTTTISTSYVVLTIYYTGGFEADILMDSQTREHALLAYILGVKQKTCCGKQMANFDDNLANSDASMAAKRNLGAEIPFEKISYIRKVMIFKCNIQGKHVVTATSMLECMIKFPRHTRAGTKDIANQTMAMNCWKDESYLDHGALFKRAMAQVPQFQPRGLG